MIPSRSLPPDAIVLSTIYGLASTADTDPLGALKSVLTVVALEPELQLPGEFWPDRQFRWSRLIQIVRDIMGIPERRFFLDRVEGRNPAMRSSRVAEVNRWSGLAHAGEPPVC